ncbi:class I SAM-dependent DNA methyltransferase [Nitrobacter winogradskyi]|uniref:TPR repeat methyltransferase n=1 Tax=Nitrobacter winogradskyi TaxID=913 RepID=A0ACC6AEJ3_NITWI|nr:class I SAM-dependent methyltransferase [Nitrobacter winogradskyi]MCP1997932.1 putative TPR repeat methyltransferase [Nitrobacter winogradskyi]
MNESSEWIIDLYERHARTFDRERGRSLFERGWLDRFRTVAGPRAAILDIGCGSGEPIARALIEAGHNITGIDSAETMIAICRERFPAQSWVVADMRSLVLRRRFGGILAWDSFFHLTQADQRAMFAVFAAHAAEGCALMFTSGPRAGEAIGSYQGEALYHASLDPDEYRALLRAHRFDVVDHIAEDAICGGHTVWLARSDGSGPAASGPVAC